MYSIGQFAQLVGKSTQTVRNWDKNKVLIPVCRTPGNQRMYSEKQLNEVLQKQTPPERINIGYARVSANHQKDDLQRQIQLLELYCAKQGHPYQIITDIGSGINYKKKGLKQLLSEVCAHKVQTVFVTHKDRLLRFGYELFEEMCVLQGTTISIINQSPTQSSEEDLVEDIMNIIHVFSCRMNGRRSHINKKLVQKLQEK